MSSRILINIMNDDRELVVWWGGLTNFGSNSPNTSTSPISDQRH